MPIYEVHARIGNAALLFMLIAGIWGIVRWRRKQAIDQNYMGILIVGELLLIGQLLLGLYMMLGLGLAPPTSRPWLHYLYGFVTALTLPAVYAYTKGRTEEVSDQALYAFVCLTIAALVYRAMITGA